MEWDEPDWDRGQRPWVHDWRTYVSPRLRELWSTFTAEQKEAIYESAEETASNEEWG